METNSASARVPARTLMSDKAARRIVSAASLLALLAVAQPALAQSADSLTSGVTQVKTWLTTIASVVGVIAVMGVGFAKLTGRLDWGKAVAVLVGIGIIFSAATIVGWMGGSAS